MVRLFYSHTVQGTLAKNHVTQVNWFLSFTYSYFAVTKILTLLINITSCVSVLALRRIKHDTVRTELSHKVYFWWDGWREIIILCLEISDSAVYSFDTNNTTAISFLVSSFSLTGNWLAPFKKGSMFSPTPLDE